jgi:hypothetical protein
MGENSPNPVTLLTPTRRKMEALYLVPFKVLPVLLQGVVASAVDERHCAAQVGQRHPAMHGHG